MSRILVAGLGNPGHQYRHTRHNMGFATLDRVASQCDLDFILHKKSPPYESTLWTVAGVSAILLKPFTYMNRSGEAVASVFNFYKIPLENLLVVHDDLELCLGRLKFVRGGGTGGHNGIRSIVSSIGSREFPRLKIGIGRPSGPVPIDKYVLSPFHPEETRVIERVLDFAVNGLICFIKKGIDSAMNEFNGLKILGPDHPCL